MLSLKAQTLMAAFLHTHAVDGNGYVDKTPYGVMLRRDAKAALEAYVSGLETRIGRQELRRPGARDCK